jgi:hypothetical protein
MLDLVFVSIAIYCIQVQELRKRNGNQFIPPDNSDKMAGHVGWRCLFQCFQVLFGQKNIVRCQQIPGKGQLMGMAINVMGIGKTQFFS